MGLGRIFEDSPAVRRKLTLWLYVLIAPPVLLASALGYDGSVPLALRIAPPAVIALAVLSIAVRPQLTAAQWIFPLAIAPALCCGFSYLAFGPSSLGIAFMAALCMPVALTAVFQERPVVIASVLASSATFLAVMAYQSGWFAALGGGVVFAFTHAATGWVSFSKAQHERALRQALRVSEEKFAKAFANSRDAIYIFDLSTGEYLEVNRGFEQLTGFRRHEAVGKSSLELELWVDPSERVLLVEELKQSGEIRGFPARFRSRTGRIFWGESTLERMEIGGRACVLASTRDISEQRQVEEVYELLRVLFEKGPVAQALTSLDGRVVRANEALSRALGYPLVGLLGRSLGELIHPDDRAAHEVAAQFSQTSREAARLEHRFMRRDGSVSWMDVSTITVFDGRSQPKYLMSTLVDITERHRVHDEVREREANFRTMFRNNPALMSMVDPIETRIVDVNDAFLRTFGYQRQEVLGRTGDELGIVSGDDQRALIAQSLRDRHRVADVELQIRRKDGALLTLLFSGELITIQGRQRLLTVMLDITARKRAEEALRTKTALLEAQMAADLDGVLVVDQQRRRVLSNQKIATLFDVPEPLCSGPDDGRLFEHIVQAVLDPAPFLDLDHDSFATRRDEIELKNGMTLERYVAPVIGSAGEHYGSIIKFRDITMQKQAAAALLEINTRLAATSAHAEDMAQRAAQASAAKSEFLAVMSHEIRTPMNGILGMTGLLLDTSLSPEQRRYAEAVNSSAEALLALTNAILDFSKIEAGKLTLELHDFDLRALFDELCEILALRPGEEQLSFVCSVAPDVPSRLRGDAGRLRQVLLNLLSNATKFTTRGEVIMRAELVSDGARQVMLRFCVRDTGIGIPADRIGILFQKFTQVDASTTRRYGGTGLGLAISKELAQMMGGEIGVTSQEGVGSEFWFTARFDLQLGAAGEPRAPLGLVGARVLVVDDHDSARSALVQQLRAWGMSVAEAADGLAAISRLREAADEGQPYRLMLADMQLRGIDGEALARMVAGDPRLSHTRTVVLATLHQRDALRLTQMGLAALISKPVRHAELLERCCQVLNVDRSTRPGDPDVRGAHDSIRQLYGLQLRILVVEDNLTNQQVALGNLRKLGFQADAVSNGVQALEALRAVSYDLVFMDIQMPDMDGIEATRRIRSQQHGVQNPQVPIIAMTAHAIRGDRESCLAAGMDDYISKPIRPALLSQLLERWLHDVAASNAPTLMDVPGPSSVHDALQPDEHAVTFDPDALLDNVMGDRELARTVVLGFLDDVPLQICALGQQLAAADARALEHQAHSIKGAAAAVGAQRLSYLARQLEHAGATGELQDATATYAALESELARLKGLLKGSILFDGTGS